MTKLVVDVFLQVFHPWTGTIAPSSDPARETEEENSERGDLT